MVFELFIASFFFVGLKKVETTISADLPKEISYDQLPVPVGVAIKPTAVTVGNSKLPQPVTTKEKKHFGNLRNHQRAAYLALILSSIGLHFPVFNLLAFPLVLYAISHIYQIAFFDLKQGRVSTATLISITAAGTIFIRGGAFLGSLITLLVIWSRQLAATLAAKSKQELAYIFEKTPDYVWVMVAGVEVKTPYDKLQLGDIVAVHAGNTIPADGIIVEGMATVDQHVLTGEAQPVEKASGDEVFSSTLVLSGKLYFKVKRAGAETTAAKITHILNNTTDFKSDVQLRSEKLSRALITPALVGGALALPLLGANSALAVINAHPKEKMGIIGPISILNHFNIALKHNILIKDGRSLELLHGVDTVVFDKTGTLTEEQPYVGRIHHLSHFHEDEILAYAAAAEYQQTHPLAKAILHEAKQRDIKLSPVEDSEYRLGYGVIVTINRQRIHVGSQRFMQTEGLEVPKMLLRQQQHAQQDGHTLIMIAVANKVCGAIELLPMVRPEAYEVIHYLKQAGKRTYIISGDHATPTANLAKKLRIDDYFAEVLPQDKAEIIKQLQAQGRSVCYVGDGINDSIALKQAQVSVSLSGASEIARDTAEIILLDKGLTHLPLLFELAEQFRSNMNTTFAIMLIPAAIGAGGAFFLHFGLAQTIALNMLALVGSLGNATLPLLRSKLEALEAQMKPNPINSLLHRKLEPEDLKSNPIIPAHDAVNFSHSGAQLG
ncbi:MAG: heavy metal translocating P-type ATPase [Thioploca sp.]|nr:heavy metal translocating P-type ATPase [Thioploca sp.]